MIPSNAGPELGVFRVEAGLPLVCGSQARLRLSYEAGPGGLPAGSRIRFGLPNTGWDRPVVPQQRYWDELAEGADRRLAPFHPVNTTVSVEFSEKVFATLDVMERMLVPDEDPAFAYWRWWITATLEGGDLEAGGRIHVLYGDLRFGLATRIQTFPEDRINITAYLLPAGGGEPRNLCGSPFYLDVVSGPASRANVVAPSVLTASGAVARLALTDECHSRPRHGIAEELLWNGAPVTVPADRVVEVPVAAGSNFLTGSGGRLWGKANPSVAASGDGLQLFWGDLHAQSEHHVMHSQRKDFRQEGWSKGISCGTLDECYQYARDVSLLDFVAMTDQGACLTSRWEYCQGMVHRYHDDGRFVVFKGYEAGSPLGHRNVIFSTSDIEPPLDAGRFHSFHPEVVFAHYRERGDVLIIPHHVKTWTDWSYHDPALEPLMEIYSCWGQSESPGLDLWNKGQTPGAGAWEAFRRGYRLGMIASSDNHVGMPGRSYPGDRQIHTPFPGGLCAVWSEALTRGSLFAALRARRCYGTTGARIIVRFHIGDCAMGGSLPASDGLCVRIEVKGADELDRVELIRNLDLWRALPARGESLHASIPIPGEPAMYYLRVWQKDGQRAWSSPIWMQ